MNEKNKKSFFEITRPLCESAVMLALSFCLSFISFRVSLFGGSVTLCAMLPLYVVSYRWGWKWGLGTCFCYAWLQILQGNPFAWGLNPTMLIGSLLLDYILPYTLLGISGFFNKFGKKGVFIGISVTCFLRLLSHFLSGVILWANYDEFIVGGIPFVNPYLYSALYNGAYMLPELAITLIAAFVLMQIPRIKSYFSPYCK